MADVKNKAFNIYAASSLGLTLVFAVAIGFAMGFYLDKWLGTSPVFTLIMFAIGIFSGFWAIYKETVLNKK